MNKKNRTPKCETHRSEPSLSVRCRDSTDDVDAAPGEVPSSWSLESDADPDESILIKHLNIYRIFANPAIFPNSHRLLTLKKRQLAFSIYIGERELFDGNRLDIQ